MRETESQLAIRRNPQKRNCKLSDPQVPKACKFKIRLAPKIDSRSMAWTMFTDDELTRIKGIKLNAHLSLPLCPGALLFRTMHQPNAPISQSAFKVVCDNCDA